MQIELSAFFLQQRVGLLWNTHTHTRHTLWVSSHTESGFCLFVQFRSFLTVFFGVNLRNTNVFNSFAVFEFLSRRRGYLKATHRV